MELIVWLYDSSENPYDYFFMKFVEICKRILFVYLIIISVTASLNVMIMTKKNFVQKAKTYQLLRYVFIRHSGMHPVKRIQPYVYLPQTFVMINPIFPTRPTRNHVKRPVNMQINVLNKIVK